MRPRTNSPLLLLFWVLSPAYNNTVAMVIASPCSGMDFFFRFAECVFWESALGGPVTSWMHHPAKRRRRQETRNSLIRLRSLQRRRITTRVTTTTEEFPLKRKRKKPVCIYKGGKLKMQPSPQGSPHQKKFPNAHFDFLSMGNLGQWSIYKL